MQQNPIYDGYIHHKNKQILYICNTCKKIQSTMNKFITSINRHNLYECLFPSDVLN